MINPDTNWLLVFAAAVASMFVGFVWYSDVLFGKEWRELMKFKKGDMDQSKKGMGKTYSISLIAAFATSFVLKQFVDLFFIVNFFDAMQLAFWVWFGFVATTLVNSVLFDGKSWKLFVINSGYQLASLIAMSTILSYF